MKTTERLGLTLPEGGDYVDVSTLAKNFELLDGLVYSDNNKPTPDALGAVPVESLNSNAYDMDVILAGGNHFKVFRVNGSVLNTPYKHDKTSASRAFIISYAPDANHGIQVAFPAGEAGAFVRYLNNSTSTMAQIGEWNRLYGENFKPTAKDVGMGNVPNVATNDQTPTYTKASTLSALKSGEKLSVSMGKIMKAIADLIAHLGNKENPHGVDCAAIGAIPVEILDSADYDMDDILTKSGAHFKVLRTSELVKNTPFATGKTTLTKASIISYSVGSLYGFQMAFSAGRVTPFCRYLNNGNIGEWGQLYGEGFKPTPADIGAVSDAGGTMAGDLVIKNQAPKVGVHSEKTDRETMISASSDGRAYLNNYKDESNYSGVYVNPETSTLDQAVRFIRKVAGGAAEGYNILHTGNLEALGSARIATGSYVGTGEAGSANACRVEVGFKPLVLIVFEKEHMSRMMMSCRPWTKYADMNITSTMNAIHCEWGENFVSWYHDTNIGGAVANQYNDNKEYQYIVFG